MISWVTLCKMKEEERKTFSAQCVVFCETMLFVSVYSHTQICLNMRMLLVAVKKGAKVIGLEKCYKTLLLLVIIMGLLFFLFFFCFFRSIFFFIIIIIFFFLPFSQIFPPSPSPTESIRLFYTSVSLLLSRIQGYRYHLSKFHIYALVYCIGVFPSGLLHSV